MTHPLKTSPRQHLLALGLAAFITAGVLSGLGSLAASDQAAQLAQQIQGAPQTSATAVLQALPAAPKA